MSSHPGGLALDNTLYQELQSEISSTSQVADAVLEEVGRLSNGDIRPVVRFNRDADVQLLVIAGEDGDELAPMLEMPQIIELVGETDLAVGLNIIPYFDITPPVETFTDGSHPQSYRELRDALDEADPYSGTELQSLAADSDIDSSEKPYSRADIEAIDEVLVHSDLLAIDVDSERPGDVMRRHLEVAVDLLYEDIPHRFYFPSLDRGGTMTTFYKEPSWYDGTVVLHAKPMYACADAHPLPSELREVVDFAETCDYGMTLHQNDDDPFFLLSYHLPDALLSRLRRTAVEEGIPLDPLDNAENFYYEIASVEEGIVRLSSPRRDMTTEFVQEGYVATELPTNLSAARTLSKRAVTNFVDYFDYQQ